MTKMYVEDSEHQIINLRQELSHSSVLCLCVWMRDGTRFSLTYLTLLVELTEATTLRRLGLLSMLIAASEESISQIGYILNNNFLLNLNYFYQFKNNNDLVSFIYYSNNQPSTTIYH